WLYQRVFFGKVENPKNEKLLDLTPRELATFLPLIAIALWIGLYPKPFFQILDQPVTAIVQQVEHPQVYNAQQAPATAPASAPQLVSEKQQASTPAQPAAVEARR
ncbi:MAG TPA: Fe-S-binding domain-containing protein, partial [Terriglobales bacterium]